MTIGKFLGHNEAINKLASKVVNKDKLPDWGRDEGLMDFLNSHG